MSNAKVQRLSPVEEINRLRQRRAWARRRSRRRTDPHRRSQWRFRAWRQLRAWEHDAYRLALRRQNAIHAPTIIASNAARSDRGELTLTGYALPREHLPAEALASGLAVAFLGWVAFAWVRGRGAAWVSSYPQAAVLLKCSVGGARKAVERLVRLGALDVARHYAEERTDSGAVERWQDSNSYRPAGWFRDVLKCSEMRRALRRAAPAERDDTTNQAATGVAAVSDSGRSYTSRLTRGRACEAGAAGGGGTSGADPAPAGRLTVSAGEAVDAVPSPASVEGKAGREGGAPAPSAARDAASQDGPQSAEAGAGGVKVRPEERPSTTAPAAPTEHERRAALNRELADLEAQRLPFPELRRRCTDALARWGFVR